MDESGFSLLIVLVNKNDRLIALVSFRMILVMQNELIRVTIYLLNIFRCWHRSPRPIFSISDDFDRSNRSIRFDSCRLAILHEGNRSSLFFSYSWTDCDRRYRFLWNLLSLSNVSHCWRASSSSIFSSQSHTNCRNTCIRVDFPQSNVCLCMKIIADVEFFSLDRLKSLHSIDSTRFLHSKFFRLMK